MQPQFNVLFDYQVDTWPPPTNYSTQFTLVVGEHPLTARALRTANRLRKDITSLAIECNGHHSLSTLIIKHLCQLLQSNDRKWIRIDVCNCSCISLPSLLQIVKNAHPPVLGVCDVHNIKGSQSLGTSLLSFKHLSRLDLIQLELDIDAYHSILDNLITNGTIRMLFIHRIHLIRNNNQYNILADQVIGKHYQLSSLEVLNIEDCDFLLSRLTMILKVMKHHPTLHSLTLKSIDNIWTLFDDVLILASWVKQPTCKLMGIEIQFINCEQGGKWTPLMESLRSNKSLVSFCLNPFEINRSGLLSLCRSLEGEHCKIQHLTVPQMGNHDRRALERLRNAVKRNKSLESLYFIERCRFRSMQVYPNLNWVCNRLNETRNVPVGLWPTILFRIAMRCYDRSYNSSVSTVFYHVLHMMVNITK